MASHPFTRIVGSFWPACIAAFVAFASTHLGRADDAFDPPSPALGRNVRGRIHIDDHPVDGAVITLCNAGTGVPLARNLRRTPTWEEHRTLVDDVWFTQSDANGDFQFDDVPPGRYRLIAQVWNDAGSFEQPFEVYDRDVIMLGNTEFEVTEAADEPLQIDFAASHGPNRLNIDGDIDEVSLILVSTEAPEDAALGLFAIAGPFATNMLGFCRGALTIEGIPDGNVGVMIIILDNLPGMNTYAYEVAGGEEVRIDVREEDMIAGWSNARRGPLPGLEAEMAEVTAIFAAGEQESLWDIITLDTEAAGTEYDGLMSYDDFERGITVIPQLGDLRRAITLPSGRGTTVGKTLAAMAYCEMARAE